MASNYHNPNTSDLLKTHSTTVTMNTITSGSFPGHCYVTTTDVKLVLNNQVVPKVEFS